MKFDILKKTKKEKQNHSYDNIDKKYCANYIIPKIEKDLGYKLVIDTTNIIESNGNVIMTAHNSFRTDDKCTIVISLPILQEETKFQTWFMDYYNVNVTVDKDNDDYLDYQFVIGNSRYEREMNYYIISSNLKERIINRDVTILKYNNNTDYIVIKDGFKLEIQTQNTNWRIEAVLQNLTDFDLIEIYKIIKNIDEKLVVNLDIKITNDELKSREELKICNGKITNYNKNYYDNDTLVSVNYQDDKLVKKTELIVDDIDNQKISDFDINDSIVKVKRLSK